MKKIIKRLVFIGLLMVSSVATAQHNHGGGGGHDDGHTEHSHPPHNGIVKEAGKYKIELVKNLFLKKNQLIFYVFKGDFKPVSTEGIMGTITIKYADGTSTTNKLVARGNDEFVAQVTKKGSFTAHVSITVKGKTYMTMFSHKSKVSSTSPSTHSCPMHPEIVGGAGESCPKCGMTLQKKK